ncbi:hypothetical protein ARMGADRAFT_910165, partial [Armillaria gallica]
IWCCWMVWGRRWSIVLFPIVSLISATGKMTDLIYSLVIKIIGTYTLFINQINKFKLIFLTIYASFVLATTLWCTLLIIYRILTVTGVNHGAGSQLRVYRHFIEVLVESSALYSISLIIFLALNLCKDMRELYLDSIVAIAKGVAPTLIIGRAAAGYTRPN